MKAKPRTPRHYRPWMRVLQRMLVVAFFVAIPIDLAGLVGFMVDFFAELGGNITHTFDALVIYLAAQLGEKHVDPNIVSVIGWLVTFGAWGLNQLLNLYAEKLWLNNRKPSPAEIRRKQKADTQRLVH